jgi:uncharacterized membrane protein SirB2
MNEADTFEISLRLLGNEVIGMKLNSQSKARNWIVLAMICLIIIAAIATEIIPLVQGVNP